MKKFMALILALACAVGLMGCVDAKTSDTTITDEITADTMTDLQTRFPEYNNLDTSEGIEVYVWQAEDGEYRCGALSGKNRNKTYEEISKLASSSTTIDEMKTILTSYNIDRAEIMVIHIEIMSFYYEIVEDFTEINDIFWGD